MEQPLIKNNFNTITILKKGKKRHKPLYKKFNRIFENPQSREKIFKFKKKKWEKLQNKLKKRKRYDRYKLFDFNNKNLGFYFLKKNKKKYKFLLYSAKKLNLFYGGLKKKYIKNILTKINKKKTNIIKKQNLIGDLTFFFIDFIERRLETILYRSFFIKSMKTAKQLIAHGYISVNKQLIKNGSYLINKNDIIEIDLKFHKSVLNNIKIFSYWRPIIQKNILINYKTLQILYTGFSHPYEKFSTIFDFDLNIHDVMYYYKYN